MPLRKARYRREPVTDVNVTNLIDIVMVMLIVFILVSNFVQTGLDIDVPNVRYVQTSGKEKILIGVNTTGEISLNGETVTQDELPARLEALKAQYPDEQVFIKADEKAFVGDFMGVASIAKMVGFEKINVPAELLKAQKK
ncbi:MAG: hypothetical protein GC154_08685 [bacterium]|nr:hypothetical protein [bacterium]